MRIRAPLPIYIVSLIFFSMCLVVSSPAEETASPKTAAVEAAQKAMGNLGVTKGDRSAFLLTNAYYGQVNGKSAEAFRDYLSDATGLTTGTRTLLDVHTAYNTPLWFSLYDKDTNKLVFAKWIDGEFKTQKIDASPEKLLKKDAWAAASQGIIGKKTLFQVVSISLAWSEGAPWEVIKTAGFHDHLCPGVNIGYLIHVWLTKNMPAGKGDTYLFFGALPKCYMDTLQVVYNSTLGKQMSYGVTMSKEQLAEYTVDGVTPSVIALKVNDRADTSEGVVFGFSWKKIMEDLGLDAADFSPKGGPSNPVFFITRVKACRQMAKTALSDKMKWLVAMKKFSGDAALAKRICNAGGDPYKLVLTDRKKVAQGVEER